MRILALIPVPAGTPVTVDFLGRDGQAVPCLGLTTAPTADQPLSSVSVDVPGTCIGPNVYNLGRLRVSGVDVSFIFTFKPGTTLDLGLLDLTPPTVTPPSTGGEVLLPSVGSGSAVSGSRGGPLVGLGISVLAAAGAMMMVAALRRISR